MYEGYKVYETIIHDYEHPDIRVKVDAPCGCQDCEGGVQPGHFACSVSAPELIDDPNTARRLDNSSWWWEFHGPEEYVDARAYSSTNQD